MRNFLLLFTALLSSILLNAQNAPSFNWLVSATDSIPMAGDVKTISIESDNQNNTYHVGTFTNSVNFDPTNGNIVSGYGNTPTNFVAKYSVSNALQWFFILGNDTSDFEIIDTEQNSDGSFFIAGHVASGTIDFDPSGNSKNHSATSQGVIVSAKYDKDGNFLWSKEVSLLSGQNVLNDITCDGSGNLYIGGYFTSSIEFRDPFENDILLSALGGSDGFIAKYDAFDGTLIFAKNIGSSRSSSVYSLGYDNSGNLNIVGKTTRNLKFDGLEKLYTTSSNASETYVAQVNAANGTYKWAINLPTTASAVYPKSIINDRNNGIYISGTFNSGNLDFGDSTITNSSGFNIFVAKYNHNAGDLVWVNNIETSSGNAAELINLELNDDKLYLAGSYFNGSIDLDPSATGNNTITPVGNRDFFIAQYDTNSTFNWGHNFGTTEQDYIADFTINSNDNLIYSGYTNSTLDIDPGAGTTTLSANDNYIGVISELDNNGNLVNNSSPDIYNFKIGGNLSSSDQDQTIVKIKEDANGNIYATGLFSGKVDFDPSANSKYLESKNTSAINNNSFLAKYNASGALLWVNAIEGTGDIQVKGLSIDENNNPVITGMFFEDISDYNPDPSITESLTATGGYGSFVIKYDEQGNSTMAFKLTAGNRDVKAEDVSTDANNNIFITGTFESNTDFDPSANTTILSPEVLRDGFLAKYDANGNFNWVNALKSSRSANPKELEINSVGDAIVIGDFENRFYPNQADTANVKFDTEGRNDAFITKFDNQGNYQWVQIIGGDNYDFADKLALGSNNEIFILGRYRNTVNFTPSISKTANGVYDNFLAKLSSNGSFEWVNSYGSASSEASYALCVDDNNNTYISILAYGNIDIDPNPSNDEIINYSINEISSIIASYDANGSFVFGKKLGGKFTYANDMLANDTKLYLGGQFETNSNFALDNNQNNFSSLNGEDIFLASYSISSCSIAEQSLENDKTICEGEDLIITLNGSETDVNYVLRNTQNNQNVSSVISGNGSSINFNLGEADESATYYVYAEKGACNLTLSDQITITVSETPKVLVALTHSRACEGDSVLLKAIVFDNNLSIEWNGPNNYTSTDIEHYINNLSIAQQGNYIITATNADGCESTAKQFVGIDAKPQFNLPANAMLCTGEEIRLSSNLQDPNFSFTWSGPNGISSTDSIISIDSLTQDYEGYFHLTVSNNGCSNSDSTLIEVNPTPQVSISSNNDLVLCPEEKTVLSASNTFSGYVWHKNNTDVNTASTILITGADFGTYYLEATNEFGCSAVSNTLEITQHTPANLSIQPEGDLFFCPDEKVNVKTNNIDISDITWYQRGSQIANNITEVDIDGGGLVYVTALDSNSCFVESNEIVLTGVGNPSKPVINKEANKLYIDTPEDSIAWYFNSNLFEVNKDTVIISQAGNYEVTVTSEYGCSSSSDILVITSITDIENNITVKAYPNPFTESITVEFSNEKASFIIRNLEGKTMQKGELVKGKNAISLSHLSKGMYQLEISTNTNAKSMVLIKN